MEVDGEVSSSSASKVKARVDQPIVRKKKSATLRDKNGVNRSLGGVAGDGGIASGTSTTGGVSAGTDDAKAKPVKEKRKKEKECGGEVPIKKKRKWVEDEEEGEAQGDVMPCKSQKSKKRAEMEVENVDVDLGSTHVLGPKKKRKSLKRGDAVDGCSTTAATSAASAIAKPKRGTTKTRADNNTNNNTHRPSNTRSKSKSKSNRRPSGDDRKDGAKPSTSTAPPSPHKPLDAETAALHAQICGLLIETMAMSRASSLPVSSLFKLVMQDQPSLKAQRSERVWVGVFERVLRSGEKGRGGSGVFGKVESSGKVCAFTCFFFFLLTIYLYFFSSSSRTTRTDRWKRSGSMCPSWTRTRKGRRLSRR
jgi:hypothetical protein